MKTIQEERELFKKDAVLYQFYATSEGYRFFLDHKEEINNPIVRKLIVSKVSEFVKMRENDNVAIYDIYRLALSWLQNDAPGKRLSAEQEKELAETQGIEPFLNYTASELGRFLFHKKLNNEQIIEELLRQMADFAENSPDKEFDTRSIYEQLELFYSKMYN